MATNSSISRCGQTLMRSPCSRSTRWMPSGGTSARSRCFSGAPFFGVGDVARGGGRRAHRRGDRAAARRPPGGRRRPPARRRVRRPRERQPRRPRPPAAGAAAGGRGRGLLGVGRAVGADGRRARAALGHPPVGALGQLGRERRVEDLLVERCVFASAIVLSSRAVPRCRRPCGSARSGPRGRSPARTAARARAARTSEAACLGPTTTPPSSRKFACLAMNGE